MPLRRGTIVIATALASFTVFCVVQDRVTAAGARRYVALQRDAQARHARAVTIDQVMGPAIDRSVQRGLLWGGAVMAAGLGLAARRR